jgi:hypothetical protein
MRRTSEFKSPELGGEPERRDILHFLRQDCSILFLHELGVRSATLAVLLIRFRYDKRVRGLRGAIGDALDAAPTARR